MDSTALDHTVVTVVITNTGLTSTFYRSKITDCPDGLPESWVNVTFPKKIVLPQRDQPVSLNLYGELSRSEFYCSGKYNDLSDDLSFVLCKLILYASSLIKTKRKLVYSRFVLDATVLSFWRA